MQSKPHYPVLSAVPVLSRNNVQKRFCSINKSSSTPCWPFSLSVLCQVCFWAVGEFQEKAMIDTVLRHPRASGELTSGCPPPKVNVGQDGEPQKSNINRWLESWAWGTSEGQTGADWVSLFHLQRWGNLNRKILLPGTHCDEEIKSDADKYMPLFPL